MRRIGVVMASSRVGYCTILNLIDQGTTEDFQVRAVFRTREKANAAKLPSCVEIAVGINVFDFNTYEQSFNGVSKAFIVAPQDENRQEIVNLLIEGGRRFGLEHVVLIGGVFQEEEKFLFHKQWMSSRRCAETRGVKWTQLECSDFMENVYRNQKSIREDSVATFVGSQGCSSPVALADVGKAAASILACPDDRHYNRAYRIIGPQILTSVEVVSTISNVLGTKVGLIHLDIAKARKEAVESGTFPEWQANGFYDWVELYFATGKLKDVTSELRLLGVEPTLFEDWFRARVEDFK